MAQKRGASGNSVLHSAGAMTPSAALEMLRKSLDKDIETPDEGFKTCVDWATDWGMSPCNAQRLLRDGAAAGKVEMRKYMIQSNSVKRKVLHYRVAG